MTPVLAPGPSIIQHYRCQTLESFLADLNNRIQMDANTGCWMWERVTDADGYGKVKISGRHMAAHRASFLAHGGELGLGDFVLHSCDTPWCVNPDHLRAGTIFDNARDAARKGRLVHNAKLTREDAELIRQLLASGDSPRMVCKKTGRHITTVKKIRKMEGTNV